MTHWNIIWNILDEVKDIIKMNFTISLYFSNMAPTNPKLTPEGYGGFPPGSMA